MMRQHKNANHHLLEDHTVSAETRPVSRRQYQAPAEAGLGAATSAPASFRPANLSACPLHRAAIALNLTFKNKIVSCQKFTVFVW